MANIQLTENLRILRERSNLKQDEFSRYLNISRQTYSNYERGTRTPDLELLKSIADFYHITIDELLFPRAKFRILNAKNPIISSISPMKS